MMFPEFDGPAIALHVPVPVHPRSAPAGALQTPSHSLESVHTRPTSLAGKTHPCVENVTLCILPPRAAHSWAVFGHARNFGLSGTGGDVGDAAQAERSAIRKDAKNAVRMVSPVTVCGAPIVSCALAGSGRSSVRFGSNAVTHPMSAIGQELTF